MSSKRLQRKKLLEVLKFIVIFNLLAIPMYLVLYFNLSFDSLRNFLAFLTSRFLVMFGVNAAQENFFVDVLANNKLLKIDISFDSTGWKTLYALFALTIATPKRKMKDKLRFLAIGLPVLFILNFLRIATTILIAVIYGFQYFEVVHIFLWREGLIAAVLLIWYLWLRQK
jgi:exosortase/archaeosortase family protein